MLWQLYSSSCGQTIFLLMAERGPTDRQRGRKFNDSSLVQMSRVAFACFLHSKKDLLFKIVKSCNLLFTLSYTTFDPQYPLRLLSLLSSLGKLAPLLCLTHLCFPLIPFHFNCFLAAAEILTNFLRSAWVIWAFKKN